MHLYAASISDDVGAWIEFYWADDDEHAREQAKNANPFMDVQCVASVPYMGGDDPTPPFV